MLGTDFLSCPRGESNWAKTRKMSGGKGSLTSGWQFERLREGGLGVVVMTRDPVATRAACGFFQGQQGGDTWLMCILKSGEEEAWVMSFGNHPKRASKSQLLPVPRRKWKELSSGGLASREFHVRMLTLGHMLVRMFANAWVHGACMWM